jgi:hypothetical protein
MSRQGEAGHERSRSGEDHRRWTDALFGASADGAQWLIALKLDARRVASAHDRQQGGGDGWVELAARA